MTVGDCDEQAKSLGKTISEASRKGKTPIPSALLDRTYATALRNLKDSQMWAGRDERRQAV